MRSVLLEGWEKKERVRLTALMMEANLKRFTAVVTPREDILGLDFKGGGLDVEAGEGCIDRMVMPDR